MDGSHQNRVSANGELYVRMRRHNIVEFMNPKPDQIWITDIAWHLARECRFTGACVSWYSNAEHSYHGSVKASCLKVAREFLLHDAAEYVFNDVSSPVGKVCPDYKRHCKAFQNFIYRKFLGYEEVSDEVQEIDRRLCATEMRDVRFQPKEDWDYEPYPIIDFVCWEWQMAYEAFMYRFKLLFPEFKDAK